MLRRRPLMITAAIVLGIARVSGAQPYAGSSGSDVGTFELSGGVLWTGGYAAGSANANLSRNPTTGTAPLTEFQTEGQMLAAPGADVHLGVYLGRRVSVEGAFQFSRPIFRARLTGDFESADAVDADETISSYLAGGSLLYHFGDGRFVPFVSGGAGYLRQLHAGNTEVLSGTEVHGGGGVKYWFGTGTRRLGLRLEAQASAREKAIAFEQKRRIVPTVAAGLSYMF